MGDVKIKPCKIHGCKPVIRSVPIKEIASFDSIKSFRQEYYCRACEQEKQNLNILSMITDWNKKQD